MKRKNSIGLIVTGILFLFLAAFIPAQAGAGDCGATPCIESFDIIDGQVKTVDLANGAVSAAKIKQNAVTGIKVLDGSLTGVDINPATTLDIGGLKVSGDVWIAGTRWGTNTGHYVWGSRLHLAGIRGGNWLTAVPNYYDLGFEETDAAFFLPVSTTSVLTGPVDLQASMTEESHGLQHSDLRLYILDDADDSFSIWGNSCGGGDCADINKASSVATFYGNGTTSLWGNVGIGASWPPMSLTVMKLSLWNRPAIGGIYYDYYAGGTNWAYLHVNDTYSGHSLIWNDTNVMRFGAESSMGSGYAEVMRINTIGSWLSVDVQKALRVGASNPDGCILVLSDDTCLSDRQNGWMSVRKADDSGWAGVEASWFAIQSTKDEKKNINKFNDENYRRVLEKVKNMNVVYYQWKDQSDAGTPHIGIIAEDSPSEILNAGGKAVNLSTYSSFLLAAIKAQQAEIEALRGQVEEMREMKAELSKLQTLLNNIIAQRLAAPANEYAVIYGR